MENKSQGRLKVPLHWVSGHYKKRVPKPCPPLRYFAHRLFSTSRLICLMLYFIISKSFFGVNSVCWYSYKPIGLHIKRSKDLTPPAEEIYLSSMYFHPYLRNWVGFSYACFKGDAKLLVLGQSLKISLGAIGYFPGSEGDAKLSVLGESLKISLGAIGWKLSWVHPSKIKIKKNKHKFSNKHI